MSRQELDPAFFRPETRRLADLTNSELGLLFRKRSDTIAAALDGHTPTQGTDYTSWTQFISRQDALYEIMLEIQSRYPAEKVKENMRLLPVVEPRSA